MQKVLTHIHFLCSVAGVLMVGTFGSAALLLLAFGARSLEYSVVYGAFVFIDAGLLSEFCVNWLWIFPIVYIILYLLAIIQKKYHIFGIAIVLDTAFRCVMTVLVHLHANISGLSNIILDSLFSLAICALFFFAGHLDKKRQQKRDAEKAAHIPQ